MYRTNDEGMVVEEAQYFHRDLMQTGDCLLWSSRTLIGRLIQWFCGAEENHASLVLRLHEYEGLRNRVFLLEALEHGIVLRLLSDRLKDYRGRVWLHRLTPDLDPHRNKIAVWALNQVGKGYDYLSLFKQAISRVNADAREFFCSEYVYFAWRNIPHHGMTTEKAPRPCDIPGLGVTMKPLLIYDSNGG
jgi:hypothetical protein